MRLAILLVTPSMSSTSATGRMPPRTGAGEGGEEKQSYGTRAAETRTQVAECQPRARDSAHGTRAQSSVPLAVLGGSLEEVERRHSQQSARHQGHWEPQAVSKQDCGPFREMAEVKDAQGSGENTQGQSKASASGTEKKVSEKVRWEGSQGLHLLEEQALGRRRPGARSSQPPSGHHARGT